MNSLMSNDYVKFIMIEIAIVGGIILTTDICRQIALTILTLG